ncbi:MAG: OB-fold nucleic acid binding domain-containing protein, partial [Candidatus Cardinium sp.]|nr:OB-fold nucleic acid binding domain-containing protein [Candidatus Cardinium sp.]
MASRIKIKKLLQSPPNSEKVTAKGWIRTKRVSKQIVFLTINDGSCQQDLQIVLFSTQLSEHLFHQLSTGASIAVTGYMVASRGEKQNVELHGQQVVVLGDAPKYPLQPKAHSLEFLRTLLHLRFRTRTFGAIFRIRHVISYAIHRFFHERGFIYLHTPI